MSDILERIDDLILQATTERSHFYVAKTARDAADRLRELGAKVDDLQRGFDLRWSADMRAMKRWQTSTGRGFTWPDHADLCVWLMEQLKAAEAKLERECEWGVPDFEDDGLVWTGACGAEWQFFDDGPEENGMNYCPRCGGKMRVKEGAL